MQEAPLSRGSEASGFVSSRLVLCAQLAAHDAGEASTKQPEGAGFRRNNGIAANRAVPRNIDTDLRGSRYPGHDRIDKRETVRNRNCAAAEGAMKQRCTASRSNRNRAPSEAEAASAAG